jgi:hypothetical protein
LVQTNQAAYQTGVMNSGNDQVSMQVFRRQRHLFRWITDSKVIIALNARLANLFD